MATASEAGAGGELTPLAEVLSGVGVGRSTSVYGVVGHPLSTTWSPALHNAAFRHLGLDAVYLPLPVSPDRFSSTMNECALAGVKGVNVTVPFKVEASFEVDRLETVSERIGSVNTIAWRDGVSTGTSTDGSGLVRDLLEEEWPVRGGRVWCLGSGGAARAVVDGLWGAGASSVLIVARRPESVTWARGHRVVAWSELAGLSEAPDLVVNATPLGGDDPLPLPWDRIPVSTHLYDLRYADRPAAWLQRGGRSGHPRRDGRGMLVHQAADSVAWWTGCEVNRDLLFEAIGGRHR